MWDSDSLAEGWMLIETSFRDSINDSRDVWIGEKRHRVKVIEDAYCCGDIEMKEREEVSSEGEFDESDEDEINESEDSDVGCDDGEWDNDCNEKVEDREKQNSLEKEVTWINGLVNENNINGSDSDNGEGDLEEEDSIGNRPENAIGIHGVQGTKEDTKGQRENIDRHDFSLESRRHERFTGNEEELAAGGVYREESMSWIGETQGDVESNAGESELKVGPGEGSGPTIGMSGKGGLDVNKNQNGLGLDVLDGDIGPKYVSNLNGLENNGLNGGPNIHGEYSRMATREDGVSMGIVNNKKNRDLGLSTEECDQTNPENEYIEVISKNSLRSSGSKGRVPPKEKKNKKGVLGATSANRNKQESRDRLWSGRVSIMKMKELARAGKTRRKVESRASSQVSGNSKKSKGGKGIMLTDKLSRINEMKEMKKFRTTIGFVCEEDCTVGMEGGGDGKNSS